MGSCKLSINKVTLICLGIVAIPLFDCKGFMMLEPRLLIATAFALALSLWAIYDGSLKPFKNKWAMFFIGYMLVSAFIMPKASVNLWGLETGNFWIWKPMFRILAFFLMMVAVSSIKLTPKDISRIFNFAIVAGVLMSLYIFFQYFTIDQRYVASGAVHEKWRIGGTLGHSTFAAAYLTMIIPLALYCKKYWKAAVIVVGVLVCQSAVATACMAISLLFYVMSRSKMMMRIFLYIMIAGAIFLTSDIVANGTNGVMGTGSGRLEDWPRIVQEINSPMDPNLVRKYPFTGRGMGSFYYTYGLITGSSMRQAHNEYMELTYNTGIFGIIIFLMAIWYMVRTNFKVGDRYRMALLSSFMAIALCAAGTFIWQMGTQAYMTILICGLLHNTTGGIK